MSETSKIEAIYVDLDVLLDTRLGTLARMDPTLADKVVSDPGYRKRKSDVFDCLDAAQILQYKELYKNRDTETLKRSMVTDAIRLLKKAVSLLAEQAVVRPYHAGSKVYVNTHPYELDEEEFVEIGKAITVWMGGLAPVELVRIAPENLTPRHCKDLYSMMIKYEYNSWMNLHVDAFRTTRLHDVDLLAPAIYEATPTDEKLKKVTKETMHPIQAMEVLASPLISLTLMDVGFFSILKPN